MDTHYRTQILRQVFKKKNIRTIFTSGPNLKSLLCWNKTKLLPNSYLGVYELKCMCTSAYLGETKKKILTRTIEHPQDSFKVKWDNSMATQHFLTCHGQFKQNRQNNDKKRKIWKVPEIKNAKYSKKIKVLNRDKGSKLTPGDCY